MLTYVDLAYQMQGYFVSKNFGIKGASYMPSNALMDLFPALFIPIILQLWILFH